MASREDPKNGHQASGDLIVDDLTKSLAWDEPPLCLLNPEQQVQFKNQAQTCRYKLGEKIWSTDSPKYQFVVVSGKVRLREEGAAQPLATLESGEWFGDLQQLSGSFKAVAASKEVVVVRWEATLWTATSSEIDGFWTQARRQLDPQATDAPQAVSGYPFVSSLNTAAACLTMLTQQLQSPAQLEWVQRQLRGQRPKHLVEAGEKIGLQLRRLQTQDLRRSPKSGGKENSTSSAGSATSVAQSDSSITTPSSVGRSS